MRPLRAVLSISAFAAAGLAAWHFAWAQGAPSAAGPLDVTVKEISSFNTLGFGTEFGRFSWRGGISLSSPAKAFGGLSGIAISGNCEELLSVSDAGNWFRARLQYRDGQLVGLSEPEMAPVLDSKGKIQRRNRWGDAEALTLIGAGKVGIAFESRVRFGSYDLGKNGLAARFQVIPHPKEIDSGEENGEVEAFGSLGDGRYIAIAEKHYDSDGNIKAWIWKGKQITAFSIARYASYDITDLAVLPDGNIMTVERSFTRTSLPGMAVRLFSIDDVKSGELRKPELLMEATLPLQAIDNMEGIALCERDGETRVTFQSDDNFNKNLQSTVLLQFAYKHQ